MFCLFICLFLHIFSAFLPFFSFLLLLFFLGGGGVWLVPLHYCLCRWLIGWWIVKDHYIFVQFWRQNFKINKMAFNTNHIISFWSQRPERCGDRDTVTCGISHNSLHAERGSLSKTSKIAPEIQFCFSARTRLFSSMISPRPMLMNTDFLFLQFLKTSRDSRYRVSGVLGRTLQT